MTDNQIKDGVNVSECKCFYTNDSHPERKECINTYCKDLCKDNPNCNYKQLARKEQECEELREKLFQVGDIIEPLHSKLPEDRVIREIFLIVNDCSNKKVNPYKQAKELDKLKAENEELKEHLKKEVEASQKWYQLHTDEHFAKLKFKQVLTKIKELAKNMNKECFYDDFDCKDCGMQNGCTYLNMKQILQLISEVENEN